MATRQPGQRLGHYELVKALGRGAMGEVWEAMLHGPMGFRKPVALKLLLAGPPDAAAREALVHEARVGALLHHPNLVGTFELGEADGTWFVAMELVRGVNVRDLARGGKIPVPVMLDIGIHTCNALAHIHSIRHDLGDRPLVHCDIKPSNLLVDRGGLIKVADLGIVSTGAADWACGTPAYVAPEQSDGRPEPRSDLWSLGVVLYLLAAQTLPFGRGAGALARSKQVESLLELPAFLQPVRDVLPGLGEVVRGCLRLDPDDRVADAATLGTSLRALRWSQSDRTTVAGVLKRARPELETVAIHPTGGSGEATRPVERAQLPPERDAFIGREAELAQLGTWLEQDERLLTISGPGGIGKTRLSLALARQVGPTMLGGALWFSLSETTTIRGICTAVARVLGVALDDQDPITQIGLALRSRGRCVALWDNLEQVAELIPATIGRWIEGAPEAISVCTTRVALRLRGEVVLSLGALGVEDGVRLFQERAPRPLKEEDLAQLPALIDALEGIPLAVELAAARTRVMSVSELEARLHDRLRLLAGGMRDRPHRHRSMVASLDGSWELLTPWGQDALSQLSVFEGSFTLPAAEAVLNVERWPEAGWALDVLQELVEASLLQLEPVSGRFRMLVVVKAYAARHAHPDDRATAERRHARWFGQLGSLNTMGSMPTQDVYDVIAACRRAVAHGDAQVAVDACSAAWTLLSRTGPPQLAFDLAEAVLTLEHSPRQAARVWVVAGRAHFACNRLSVAAEAFETALDLAEEAGADDLIGGVHGGLGYARYRLGELETAIGHLNAARVLATARGDVQLQLRTIGGLATIQSRMGRMEDARAQALAALELARRAGDQEGIGRVLSSLGGLALAHQDAAAAVDWYTDALAIQQELEDRTGQAMTFANLGASLSQLARMDEAQHHLETAIALFGRTGSAHHLDKALNQLALVHQRCGRWDEALDCYQRALTLAEEAGDLRIVAATRSRLGTLCFLRGDIDTALTHFEAAIELSGRVGDLRERCWTRSNLALYLLQLGRFERATRELKRAMSEARGLDDRRLEGIFLGYLGMAQLEDGTELTIARATLAEAEAILREHGTASALSRLLCDRADGDLRAGHEESARSALDEAERFAQELAPIHREEVIARIAALRQDLP